jgi:2-keto-4-pentenoate hydratase/2-oxohepta-3-ene-1,7-dioic acid hydratase in catechol pathway
MKYCRFRSNGQPAYGFVEGDGDSQRITRVLLKTPHAGDEELQDLPSRKMDPLRLPDAQLLPPVEPSKIICVGRNYREHAAELGNEVPAEPLLFFKPPSSLYPSRLPIRRPKLSQRVDYEGELGVVIRKQCHKLAADANVRPYILGYTCVNDVTARDLQNKDGQWTRAKGFDTFCPVGPLVTDEIDPWAGVEVETRVNNEIRQKGNTRDFIFSLDVIIRYISQVMTLYPGDLIATGTPKGVGPIYAGEVVSVKVDGVGTLSNPVSDE